MVLFSQENSQLNERSPLTTKEAEDSVTVQTARRPRPQGLLSPYLLGREGEQEKAIGNEGQPDHFSLCLLSLHNYIPCPIINDRNCPLVPGKASLSMFNM